MDAVKNFKVYGLSLPYVIPCAAILLIAVCGGWLQGDMNGTLLFIFCVGGFLFELGKRIPILKKFGAPVLLPLFGGALLSFFNILPESVADQCKSWVGGWQNLFVGAVLVGSIMMVNRKILLKSVSRFIPAILVAQFCAMALVAVGCLITGYSLKEGLFYVCAPLLSGGVSGPSAVLGPMYTEISGTDMTSLAGLMVCYDNIGNVLAIVGSGILARFCLDNPKLAGHGKMIVGQDKLELGEEKRPMASDDYTRLATGAFVVAAFMVAGNILGKVVPVSIHGVAWAIILCLIFKCAGWLPAELEDSTIYWNQFIMKNFLAPLVLCIGIRYLDLHALAAYFDWKALIMIVLTLSGATGGAMAAGKILGLYPLETGLAAGLCNCNSGGSGDIACLSAADCMEVLPFASISTRIGGGLMLVWASLLFPFFV